MVMKFNKQFPIDIEGCSETSLPFHSHFAQTRIKEIYFTKQQITTALMEANILKFFMVHMISPGDDTTH